MRQSRSPHPFIARIPLAFSLLLPLLISPLLFLLLDTPLSPVPLLFLIHLVLVRGGLIDVWRPVSRSIGRVCIRRRLHCKEGGLREQATQATQAARRLRELQAAGSLGEAPLNTQ